MPIAETRVLEGRPGPFLAGAGYTLFRVTEPRAGYPEYVPVFGGTTAHFTSQASRAGKRDLVAAGLASTRDWSDGAQSLLGENSAEEGERGLRHFWGSSGHSTM